MENVRSLTAVEIETFRRDGAAHIPALISPAAARQLLEAADAARAAAQVDSFDYFQDGTFWDARDLYLDNAILKSFAFESQLAREAGRAMGARQCGFYFDHLFMLAADTAKDRYYWHQDQPFWACQGDQICSFWLALTDCSVDSGALEVVLGTDKQMYPPEWFQNDENGKRDETLITPAYHEMRDRFDIKTWDIRAGDALLFNSKVMHSSRGNHSKTQRRVAYSTRWFGDDAVFFNRGSEHQDPVTVPDPMPADGTPLTVAGKFPVLWREETAA